MIKHGQAIAEANEILRDALPQIGADQVMLGPCSFGSHHQLVGFRMIEGPPRAVMIHRVPSTAVEGADYDIRDVMRDAINAALKRKWVDDLTIIKRV